MSNPKEPHYFSTDLEWRFRGRPLNTEKAYLELFEGTNDYLIRGEASVWYLYSKDVAQSIYEFNPDAKIIIALRDPVEMVYSLFRFAIKTGSETIRSFRDALAAEPARSRGERLPRSLLLKNLLLYRAAASYPDQVNRYIAQFDRSQLKFILFDDLNAHPHQLCSDLFAFLDLQTDVRIDCTPQNKTSNLEIERINWIRRRFPRSFRFAGQFFTGLPRQIIRGTLSAACPKPITITEPIPEDLRVELRDYFRPDVERISEIIQRDLSHWTNGEKDRNSR